LSVEWHTPTSRSLAGPAFAFSRETASCPRSSTRSAWSAQARFWISLPSGLLVEDLAAVRTVLAVSCGATGVVVVRDGPRQDRAVVIVVRPRWGWPGR
jgi:hypothetical protein